MYFVHINALGSSLRIAYSREKNKWILSPYLPLENRVKLKLHSIPSTHTLVPTKQAHRRIGGIMTILEISHQMCEWLHGWLNCFVLNWITSFTLCKEFRPWAICAMRNLPNQAWVVQGDTLFAFWDIYVHSFIHTVFSSLKSK